ncbi:NLI interacting factor-like phosphatase-domain-containing protein [Cyathus striatus]|nr:NLI interacting factor-like phosphatase-domain-containing protein [Cyathus striatus]
MNSLTYLSRQFDVLASPKAPPSTPTNEHSPRIPSSHSLDGHPLQRVNTWSKSFLFPPASFISGSPRRSYSSPSFASPHNNSSSSLQPSSIASSSSPSSSSTVQDIPPARSKRKGLADYIKQIFFFRVFLLVWDNLHSAWTSLVHQFAAFGLRRVDVVIASLVPDRKGKRRAADSEPIEGPSISQFEVIPLESSRHFTLQTRQSPVDSNIQDYIGQSSSSVASATGVYTPSSDITRSTTPVFVTKKTPFHLQKTLVLDLDETLIHSTSKPIPSAAGGGSGFFGLGTLGRRNKGAGHTVEVVLGGRSTLYHVYKRPFVDFFLRTVSGWYTLVIFTASMQEYADPVIDWLDGGRGILSNRFFRDSCTQLPNRGGYVKDLSIVETDLSRVCLVDNSPESYRVNEANGIPIEGWTHDPSDEALLDLLPVLDSLRFTSDVRRVLGLRTAGQRHVSS